MEVEIKMNNYIVDEVKQRLNDAGVNINAIDFWKTEEFQPFIEEYYLGGPEGKITIREIVERYILSDEEVMKLYKSKYDMGNRIILSEEDCQYSKLAEELNKVLNHEVSVDAKEFYRSNGLRDRIKKFLLIDLDKYKTDFKNDDYDRNTSEVFKLLYLFYLLENSAYKDRNVLKMLGNPSLENVDNSMIGLSTSNGAIMKDLKDSAERELSTDYRAKVKSTIWKIVIEWEDVISAISGIIDYSEENGLKHDMDLMIGKYSKVAMGMETEIIPDKYDDSPIEQLYLRLCQHENLGREKDILFINSLDIDNQKRTREQIEKLKELRKKVVKKDDVGLFIKTHCHDIAPLVYLRKVSSKEGEALTKLIDKVNLILEFFTRETKLFIHTKNTVSVTYIISCLQAIVLSEQNEKFNYKFPAYDKVTRTPRSVQNSLNYQEVDVFEALKTYFVRKVMECWNCNIGREYAKKQMTILENICDSLLYKILQIPNMEDMKLAHDYLIKRIGHDVFEFSEKARAKEVMTNKLLDLGYRYNDPKNIIGNAFYESGIMDENLNEIYENISNSIFDESWEELIESSFDYEISMSDNFVVGKQHLAFIVDKIKKVVYPAEKFEGIEFSDGYLERLQKIGVKLV